jgi:uncharacterized phage protein gp47/JayE
MDYGVTEAGFVIKEYDVILEEMQAEAQEKFGADVDLTDRSPLGLFIKLMAWAVFDEWQQLEAVYNNAYVDTATEQSLDYVGKFIGISRKEAIAATGEVVFTGAEGAVIPAGFLVAAVDGSVRFLTTQAATIEVGQTTVTVPVECETPGVIGNLAIDVVVGIVNPQSGIEAVTNPKATGDATQGFVPGAEVESDEEFRERYRLSTAAGGSGTCDAIRAAILGVPNVRTCKVVDNKTTVTDGAGRPAKSVAPIVIGGTDQDIAEAILNTKAAGIEAYGSTVINLTDLSGNTQQVGFTRATALDVYVTVTVTKNAKYPLEGDALVKEAVIKAVGGTGTSGAVHQGLSMGDDVYQSQLVYVAHSACDGIVAVDVKLGFSANPTGTANLAVGDLEVASTDATKVVVS